jgi:long-chain fatty acid transport protein
MRDNYLTIDRAALLLALVLFAQTADAGNGINLIGFGVESWFLAGADVAVSRDTGALTTNPAGLTQLHGLAFDSHGGVASTSGTRHRDQFGNDQHVDNQILVMGDFGFAQRRPDSRFTWGIGLFAQGGAGSVYRNLDTAFGTRDELSALFRIAKLSPAVAYQATDKLALGVSIPVVYSNFKQKFFPATSLANAAPAPSFFGNELSDASAVNAGAKLGLMYRATDSLTLGLTYTNEIDLTLKEGQLRVNYDAIGLGRVTYRDAEVAGLHLPQEIALGAAQRVGERWLFAVKLSWLDWSRAFRTLKLSAHAPDNAQAPATVNIAAKLDWRDQYVIAAGLGYEATPGTTLLAGVNYGRNPVPSETTTPLLAGIGEMHATLGIIHKLNSNWQASAGIEYDFAKTVTYTNPELPFGANAQARSEIIGVHFGIGRRW